MPNIATARCRCPTCCGSRALYGQASNAAGSHAPLPLDFQQRMPRRGYQMTHSTDCTCCGDLLGARYNRRRFLQATASAGLLAAFPSFAFAAEGNYDAMLLTCLDPRFPEPYFNYMKSRN